MAQAEEIRTETGPLDYDYTEKEVELCQENLQNHKACSPDKIKNEMLKELREAEEEMRLFKEEWLKGEDEKMAAMLGVLFIPVPEEVEEELGRFVATIWKEELEAQTREAEEAEEEEEVIDLTVRRHLIRLKKSEGIQPVSPTLQIADASFFSQPPFELSHLSSCWHKLAAVFFISFQLAQVDSPSRAHIFFNSPDSPHLPVCWHNLF
eukprot:g46751.t1